MNGGTTRRRTPIFHNPSRTRQEKDKNKTTLSSHKLREKGKTNMETALQTLPATLEHTAELPLHVQDLPVANKGEPAIAVQVMEGVTFSAILITFSYLFAVVAGTMI